MVRGCGPILPGRMDSRGGCPHTISDEIRANAQYAIAPLLNSAYLVAVRSSKRNSIG
jgi:hypothetical protein